MTILRLWFLKNRRNQLACIIHKTELVKNFSIILDKERVDIR